MRENPAPPGSYGPREGVERLWQAARDTIREQLAEDQGAPPPPDDGIREPANDAIPPSPAG
jgi:hypothetical protein